jgi:hypothetical protein
MLKGTIKAAPRLIVRCAIAASMLGRLSVDFANGIFVLAPGIRIVEDV